MTILLILVFAHGPTLVGRHREGQEEVELPQVFCLFDKDWEGPKEAELPRDLTKSETERKTANRSRV